MTTEEDYEDMCKRIQRANAKFLDAFHTYLTDEKKLTEKTALKHGNNIAFFGNDFVLNYESGTLDQASAFISVFLGSWFIRKCMWSSPTAIKENILSFKKFYLWMKNNNHISKEDYTTLLSTIKEEQTEWLETCRKYNDPAVDFEDVFPY